MTAEEHLKIGRERLARRDAAGALVALRAAVTVDPGDHRSLFDLGVSYQLAGQLQTAILCHRRAAHVAPNDQRITSNLIVLRDFDPTASMADMGAERRAFQRRHAGDIRPAKKHQNLRSVTRPLRIGYVSSYFLRASGASIFYSVLKNHDSANYVPFCYSSTRKPDILTERIRDHCRWVEVGGQPDKDVAERIRRDRIDILVDLDGHSPGNRLKLFAHKPAPIQITGWGHAGGTGLDAMDYAFVDPVFAPSEDQPHFAERLLNLPCVLTVEMPAAAPPVTPPPVERNGYLTFGCLNRLTKVSREVLEVWARIMAGVPESRLLLKGRLLDGQAFAGHVKGLMASFGIPESRLILRGGTPWGEHLAAHGDVDVALDPFPLNGGVATVEALWMGTPVVTFSGPTMYSRVSAAILTAAGAPELIATDLDLYVGLAGRLAADRPALARYRAVLRDQLARSPVANSALYTRAVEQAFRDVWATWCAQAR